MNAGKTNPDRFILFALTLVMGLLAPSWAVGADRVPDELLAAVNASRHRIEAAGGGHQADNPGNRLHFQFGEEAVNIAPSSPGQSWQLALKLTGYGTPDKIKPVAAATVAAKGANRLEYRRGALTEWYENRPEGLEQGFTLTQPPQPGAKTVVLDLAVSGGLKPQLAKDAQSVALLDLAGKAALTYGDLKVIDARGANLPAKLALADGKVRIAVQTKEAIWPIVVDPLVKSAVIKTGDGGGADRFGFSVAISGTLAVVGAPLDTHNGVNQGGAAYVYERAANGTTWNQKGGEITNTIANQRRGYAVATDGNMVVLGAPGNGTTGGESPGQIGHAYVFTWNGTTWVEAFDFTGSSVVNNYLGASVAIYNDTIAVGEPNADNGGSPFSGANNGKGRVWIIYKSFIPFDSISYIKATNGGANLDFFGKSVALSGTRLVVGAPGGQPAAVS